jgi:AcrR family transcriptional regulator
MYSSMVNDTQSTALRPPAGRLDRRKARTRAALIEAAQALLAEGRTNVPIQEITEAADLGTGSFYNHFESKDDLFRAAKSDALEKQADLLDAATVGIDDPAVVFAQSFRLVGRVHRALPELSKTVLSEGLAAVSATSGMVPRARRDIQAAAEAGRFTVHDLDAVMITVVGASLALGWMLHDRPDLDDAVTTDLVTRDILRVLGMTSRQADKICSMPLPDLVL